MASLVEHIHRMVDRFWDLPLLLVPSARVTDEDTARWSEERRVKDLEDEPKQRTGEE